MNARTLERVIYAWLEQNGEQPQLQRTEIAKHLAVCIEGAEIAEAMRNTPVGEQTILTAQEILGLIPQRYQVRVREGGGFENLGASVLVSLVKWKSETE